MNQMNQTNSALDTGGHPAAIDTPEAARAWLEQLEHAEALITRLYEMSHSMRQSMMKRTGQMEKSGVKAPSSGERLSGEMGALLEVEEEIQRQLARLSSMRKEAIQTIALIPNANRQAVLLGRYLEGKTWSVLSYEMPYDCRTLYRYHREGLKAFPKAWQQLHQSGQGAVCRTG